MSSVKNSFHAGLTVLSEPRKSAWQRRLPAICALLMFSGEVEAAQEIHKVDFHVQGGSFDRIGKRDGQTAVTIVSKEPISKSEAIEALEDLLTGIRRLADKREVTRKDYETAEALIADVQRYVRRHARGGQKAAGKSKSFSKSGIRVDCEDHKGYLFVDDYPHAFIVSATTLGKTVKRTWKGRNENDNPGRKVGRSEFEKLKETVFERTGLDPKKKGDKDTAMRDVWTQARKWFNEAVLRAGIIEGDPPKAKTFRSKAHEKLELKLEIKMLNGIGFIEEN